MLNFVLYARQATFLSPRDWLYYIGIEIWKYVTLDADSKPVPAPEEYLLLKNKKTFLNKGVLKTIVCI